MVCTLEPCNHQGKQPPCTEALSPPACGAWSRRSPIPTRWPPAARRGSARRESTSSSASSPMRPRRRTPSSSTSTANHSRPYVALKLATTIDGRIADANGNSRWISAQPARDFVHWLRAGLRRDRGRRRDRPSGRSLAHRPRSPGAADARRRRIVFAADGDSPVAPPGPHGARDADDAVVASALAKPERLGAARSRGRRASCARRGLVEALRALREDGVTSLLVEGGGRLAGALLAAGLVDRYYWVQTPLWLGVSAVPAVAGLPTTPLDEAARWRVSRAAGAGRGHPAGAGPALMFTGIVTAVGTVRGRVATTAGLELTIACSLWSDSCRAKASRWTAPA